MDNSSKRPKSRDYPAISLRKAVDFARRIYEKDRWTESPALTAAMHMGYAGLNGGSRPVLSALKKFGLVEYIGSSDNMRVKLTDLTKRIILPVTEAERAAAVWEAMSAPAIHMELASAFPDWDLPSDETLAARLEREFGLQHGAVKPFIADLRESLDFARSFKANRDDGKPDHTSEFEDPAPQSPRKRDDVSQAPSCPGMIKLPMPGSSTFIVLPDAIELPEARRILSWLKRVVTPAIEFASGQDEVDETS